MTNDRDRARAVERLFPFVLRARILLVGRETLLRSKSKLHFVLITDDLSEQSRKEILSEFAHYPIVQRYTSTELKQFFGLEGTKVIAFAKSGLAQSIYAELKEHRINKPVSREFSSTTDGRCAAGEPRNTRNTRKAR